MNYKTIVVESSAGIFKSSYQKLGPLIDDACNKLAGQGYEVISICTIGMPKEPAALVTAVKRS